MVLEGQPLPEGAEVLVWIDEVSGFELDEQSQLERVDADASIDRGEGISAEDLLKRLAKL